MSDTSSSALQYLRQFAENFQDSVYTRHKHAKQWFQHHNMRASDFRNLSQSMLAAGSVAGMIGSQPTVNAQVAKIMQDAPAEEQKVMAHITQEEFDALMQKMRSFTDGQPGHLPTTEELYLEQQLHDLLGFEVTAELDGNRLNHSVGIMGGEQHLRRYPGDSLANHDAYQEAGMAPARGAFGWFVEGDALTDKAIQAEKYYLAVQTLYLPNWNQDYPQLKPWYKFRKMIVVNPYDEMAVVAVVGDAGPAQWVQKQFGGSPEVIREGKIWSGAARGRTLVWFVNDPQDTIPLGPISLRKIAESAMLEVAQS